MKCPKCNGSGFVEFEEDDRPVIDACYHCGNTGQIDEVQAFNNMVYELAEILASAAISDQIKRINQSAQEQGEGEGWDFMAAENGLTGYELEKMRFMELEDKFSRDLGNLQTATIEAIAMKVMPEVFAAYKKSLYTV